VKFPLIRPLAVFLALSAAALIAGCGFHLEGRTVLPAVMRRPYIEASNQQSDFVQSLRRDLLISGARPVDTATGASAVIEVHTDQVHRRVLSVSATNRPTEYEVTYTVGFSVSAGGKTLLERQTLSARRSYTFNESLLLATEHEQAILTGAMGRNLADIVMRRLAKL
jgi:LPS-assembly lipoprotein